MRGAEVAGPSPDRSQDCASGLTVRSACLNTQAPQRQVHHAARHRRREESEHVAAGVGRGWLLCLPCCARAFGCPAAAWTAALCRHRPQQPPPARGQNGQRPPSPQRAPQTADPCVPCLGPGVCVMCARGYAMAQAQRSRGARAAQLTGSREGAARGLSGGGLRRGENVGIGRETMATRHHPARCHPRGLPRAPARPAAAPASKTKTTADSDAVLMPGMSCNYSALEMLHAHVMVCVENDHPSACQAGAA